jgi:hypothetical protein
LLEVSGNESLSFGATTGLLASISDTKLLPNSSSRVGIRKFGGFFVIPSVTYFLFFVLMVFTSHGPCESNSLSLSEVAWDFLDSESYCWMELGIFG